MIQSLSASLAGVSGEQEAQCDAWFAAGDKLRAAVGWRYFSGKGEILSLGSGVHLDNIKAFVETGEISDLDKQLLEAVR